MTGITCWLPSLGAGAGNGGGNRNAREIADTARAKKCITGLVCPCAPPQAGPPLAA